MVTDYRPRRSRKKQRVARWWAIPTCGETLSGSGTRITLGAATRSTMEPRWWDTMMAVRYRWERIAPTATGCMTWRVTSLSGAGTGMITAGMTTPVPRHQIRAALTQPPGRACCGAARGATAPAACAAPGASTSVRCSRTASSGFGVRGGFNFFPLPTGFGG